MFLVALAAAAESPHSITGAFGYVLGQAPPAKVATCNRTWLAQLRMTEFGCPGDSFFTGFAVSTRRNQVTSILAFRRYPAAQPGAFAACLADVNRLNAQVRRDNPGLAEAENKSATFEFSESLVHGRWAAGHHITGNCDPKPRPSFSAGDYFLLTLSYRVSPEEDIALHKLDQAEFGIK
jgi:hypothetical protein